MQPKRNDSADASLSSESSSNEEADEERASDASDAPGSDEPMTAEDFIRAEAASIARAEERARRAARREAKASKKAETPRPGVKLQRLTSISAGGGTAPKSEGKARECHACGRRGHMKKDCPSRRRG